MQKVHTIMVEIESSRFATIFRGISRVGSAFFLRWFKLAHICIQVTSHHNSDRSEPIANFFIRKSISY